MILLALLVVIWKPCGFSDILFAPETREANITAKQYHSTKANRVGVVSLGTQRLTAGAFPLSQEKKTVAIDGMIWYNENRIPENAFVQFMDREDCG